MSTKRGNIQRTRAQKHQNKTKFKNDLHDTSNKIKLINSIKIAEVCERCAAIIEWKRQYRKYKPLSQPKKCNKCGNRSVKQAYHMICTPCATEARQCAKCLVSADQAQIIPPVKSEQEELRERAEIDKLLKILPERRRRTFLRYLDKKKKTTTLGVDEQQEKEKASFDLKAEEEKLKKFITAADLDKNEMELVRRMEEKLGFLWDLEEGDDNSSSGDSDDLQSDFDQD